MKKTIITPKNTPIEELLAEYESEMCDFTFTEWVIRAAHRYVWTMEDSQVRCLLHVLGCHAEGVPFRSKKITRNRKPMSEEHRQNLKLAWAKKTPQELQAHREKISKAQKRRPMSDAHKKAIGDAHRGKAKSNKHRASMSIAQQRRRFQGATQRT